MFQGTFFLEQSIHEVNLSQHNFLSEIKNLIRPCNDVNELYRPVAYMNMCVLNIQSIVNAFSAMTLSGFSLSQHTMADTLLAMVRYGMSFVINMTNALVSCGGLLTGLITSLFSLSHVTRIDVQQNQAPFDKSDTVLNNGMSELSPKSTTEDEDDYNCSFVKKDSVDILTAMRF